MSKKPARKTAKKSSKKAAAKPARKPAAKSAAGKKATARKAASAAASNAIAKRTSTFMRFAHKMVADMAAGIPDDRACHQLPGADNHKLWTLGHLAGTNQWFAMLIDGQPITFPREWDKMFGMGSKPTADAATYPPIADVRSAFEASIDRLCAAVDALNDAELAAPPAGDGSGFVTDKLDSALKAAWHNGWHLGQVAALRRGLGVGPMMGG